TGSDISPPLTCILSKSKSILPSASAANLSPRIGFRARLSRALPYTVGRYVSLSFVILIFSFSMSIDLPCQTMSLLHDVGARAALRQPRLPRREIPAQTLRERVARGVRQEREDAFCLGEHLAALDDHELAAHLHETASIPHELAGRAQRLAE